MIHTYIAKKFNPIFFIGFFLFLINYSISSFADQKIAFWDEPKKGANIFNRQILQEDIKAAKNFGIAFIRLAPDKFISNNRDFLIGNVDNYTKLSEKDLKYLKEILDMFATEQMPVVLTMLSLPGSRWKQNNHDQDDLRIWEDIKFQKQAAKFWQDIALELKDHPAMIGYNILNEPHLERLLPRKR
ncbi:cellulase family glycosylhydrolase [Rickettsia endosymbiont of Orchestes rusci]|uniref:cellulase family glycosylhydrolase n=1 Tax=Rickettsia endosymbiont of Orchestes rusci TaxID=3066250 RepID=UPI00313ECEBB